MIHSQRWSMNWTFQVLIGYRQLMQLVLPSQVSPRRTWCTGPRMDVVTWSCMHHRQPPRTSMFHIHDQDSLFNWHCWIDNNNPIWFYRPVSSMKSLHILLAALLVITISYVAGHGSVQDTEGDDDDDGYKPFDGATDWKVDCCGWATSDSTGVTRSWDDIYWSWTQSMPLFIKISSNKFVSLLSISSSIYHEFYRPASTVVVFNSGQDWIDWILAHINLVSLIQSLRWCSALSFICWEVRKRSFVSRWCRAR